MCVCVSVCRYIHEYTCLCNSVCIHIYMYIYTAGMHVCTDINETHKHI